MSYSLAMDQQAALLNYWRSEVGRDYGRIYQESLKNDYGEDMSGLSSGNENALSIMSEIQIGGAEPIYVSADVCKLIEHARESWRPEPLLPQDVMVPWGFAYLADTLANLSGELVMEDALHPAAQIPISAIAWAPYKREWLDTANIDVLDAVLKQIGEVVQGTRYATTKLLDTPENAEGILVALYAKPNDLTALEGLTQEQNKWPLVLTHWTRQPFGINAADTPAYAKNEVAESVIASAQSFDTMMQVFFRLMQQRIAVQHYEQAARPVWRRAQRSGIDNKRVLVVTLRRPSNPKPTDSSPVDWSHRWIVGGHWRNQWYPSLGEHRQIWVADYEKGPEDKPLVIKQRAFTFKR